MDERNRPRDQRPCPSLLLRTSRTSALRRRPQLPVAPGQPAFFCTRTPHPDTPRAEIPDVGRTPDLLNQSAHTALGQPNNATLQSLAALDYNTQLAHNLDAFKANSSALGIEVDVSIYPTHYFFDFTLDNAEVIGFTNITGEWHEARRCELGLTSGQRDGGRACLIKTSTQRRRISGGTSMGFPQC